MLKGCKENKKWIDDDLMWTDDKACIKAIKKGRFKAILAGKCIMCSQYSFFVGVSKYMTNRLFLDFGFARANIYKEHERQQSRVNLRLSAVGTK